MVRRALLLLALTAASAQAQPTAFTSGLNNREYFEDWFIPSFWETPRTGVFVDQDGGGPGLRFRKVS